MTLENWFVFSSPSGFTIDGYFRPTIWGNLYGDPDVADGEPIITSYIVEVQGLFVGTYSGSVYILGQVDYHFGELLRTKDKLFDPASPLKLRSFL
jgi:hypothetical protein